MMLITEEVTIAPPKNAAGKYYCPMFAKTIKYMMKRAIVLFVVWTLVQAPDLTPAKQCTPAPCILKLSRKGPCPTCGMDLVPMEPTESEDNKAFLDLWRKMKIAIVLRCLFLSSRCQK
jgi:Cu2+-exporting ATPase